MRGMSYSDLDQYMAFMYDRENSHKCVHCPENIGAESIDPVLPCGQFHCWVDLHTRRQKRNE